MSKPKLSTKTPDAKERNALIEAHGGIIDMPRERRYAIVELATQNVRTDIATGEEQATLQIVHCELPTGSDRDALEKLMDKVFQKRTNLKVRPDPNAEVDTPLEGLGDGPGLDDSVI